MLHIPITTTPDALEHLLLDALHEVTLVGQLPLDARDFGAICGVLRQSLMSRGLPRIEKVPPALLVTSMVFTARYSGEEYRTFWTPYARRVWGLEEASQTFQVACREQFSRSVEVLEQSHDLYFGQEYYGDVVRPIYRHAIIPHYLQDDFSRWLQGRWETFNQLSPDQAAQLLLSDPGLRYLPPTLRKFLVSPETVDAAVDLITNLASTIGIYVEGETPDNIEQILRRNPIELSIWQELRQVVDTAKPAAPSRIAKRIVRPSWVWDRDENILALRLQGLRLISIAKPDRVVWLSADDDKTTRSPTEYIIPFSESDGWWIDDVVLRVDTVNGRLAVLDQNDNVLYAESPIPLPNAPVIFFRPGASGYASLATRDNRGLPSGIWQLCLGENVTLTDAHGNPIQANELLPVPFPLNELSGFASAGVYEITPPIRILVNNAPAELITRRSAVVSPPYLESPDRIAGLSANTAPAFTSRDISLMLPLPDRQTARRLAIWVRAEGHSFYRSLDDLLAHGHADWLPETILCINLHSALTDVPAVYTVDILQGPNSALASPLQMAVLPEIVITPPNLGQLYTPRNLPFCEIEGVWPEELVLSASQNSTDDDTVLRVTWTDLREPCRLLFRFEDRHIALVWDLKRVWAWLTPEQRNEAWPINDFSRAVLHVVAPPSIRLQIGAGEADLRDLAIPASGHYESPVDRDPLLDMVRLHGSPEVNLILRASSQQWQFARVLKTLSIENPFVGYIQRPGHRGLIFRCQIEHEWRGDFTLEVEDLYTGESTLLGTFPVLRESQVIPCELETGIYRLQVKRDNVPLLDHSEALFAVNVPGTHNVESFRAYAALVNKNTPFIPFRVARAYGELGLLRGARPSLFDGPEWLRWLTLPSIPDDLQTTDRWFEAIGAGSRFVVDERGLLPAWIVLSDRIRLTLILPAGQINLGIIPEAVSRHAERGIGRAIPRGQGGHELYTQWGKSDKNQYEVIVGRIDGDPPAHFVDVDPDEIWRVRQCAGCGQIEIVARSALDEKALERHRGCYLVQGERQNEVLANDQIERRLKWIEHDITLRAYRDFIPSPAEPSCAFRPPQDFIDLGQAEALWHTPTPAIATRRPFDIGRSNYLDAVSEAAVKAISFTRQQAQLSQSPIAQAFLVAMNEGRADVPAFAAAHRFLNAVGLQAGGNSTSSRLTTAMLILGTALRALASEQRDRALSILSSKGVGLSDLAYCIEISRQACPGLLAWGLAWGEVFRVNAIS